MYWLFKTKTNYRFGEHNETRGSENVLLLEKLQDLEYKVEVLSMKKLYLVVKFSMTNLNLQINKSIVLVNTKPKDKY